jgi:protein O-GlcNAc transferase
MAASLLTTLKLPELITDNQAAYETLAIELATHPTKLAAIKAKLAENKLKTIAFDTPFFTQQLEAAYTERFEKYYNT